MHAAVLIAKSTLVCWSTRWGPSVVCVKVRTKGCPSVVCSTCTAAGVLARIATLTWPGSLMHAVLVALYEEQEKPKQAVE